MSGPDSVRFGIREGTTMRGEFIAKWQGGGQEVNKCCSVRLAIWPAPRPLPDVMKMGRSYFGKNRSWPIFLKTPKP